MLCCCADVKITKLQLCTCQISITLIKQPQQGATNFEHYVLYPLIKNCHSSVLKEVFNIWFGNWEGKLTVACDDVQNVNMV